MTFRERVERRRREQRRKLKKAAACAALAGLAILFVGLAGRPSADTHIVDTTYTVKPGDTWWNIIERFRDVDADDPYIVDYKHEQEQLNQGVDFGNLMPGQTLHIMYREKD